MNVSINLIFKKFNQDRWIENVSLTIAIASECLDQFLFFPIILNQLTFASIRTSLRNVLPIEFEHIL